MGLNNPSSSGPVTEITNAGGRVSIDGSGSVHVTPASGQNTNIAGGALEITASAVIDGDFADSKAVDGFRFYTGVGDGTLTLEVLPAGLKVLGAAFGTAAFTNSGIYDAAGAASSAQAAAVQRTNHTGTQALSTISGLGTGIATALAIGTGSAGAPVLFNGAGGTPSSLTLTSATSLPAAGVTGIAITQTTLNNATLSASFTTLATSGVVTITNTTAPTTGGAGALVLSGGIYSTKRIYTALDFVSEAGGIQLYKDSGAATAGNIGLRVPGDANGNDFIISTYLAASGWFGQLYIKNVASNNAQVCWGGVGATFPSIKRSATALQSRLGDDSGYGSFQGKLTTDTAATTGLTAGVLSALTNSSIVLYDSTGQAYRVPCII